MALDEETGITPESESAFGSGFDEKPAPKVEAKPEATSTPESVTETPAVKVESKPEYAQITVDRLAELEKAAARTASHEAQLSKAFGTIGKLQQLITEVREKMPKGDDVKLSTPAYEKMLEQFPELAGATKGMVEELLSASQSTQIDYKSEIDRLRAERREAELEALSDEFPNWSVIVGAVDEGQPHDPENPFRKWLAGKDETYQKRVNKSLSSAVIARAIRAFQEETKPPAKPSPTPRADTRREQLQAAVQPKGDGGAPSTANPQEDAFAAGFAGR